MKEEYDLSKMKTRPNPYAKRLIKQVTLRIGQDVIDYFKGLSEKTGVPYHSLINPSSGTVLHLMTVTIIILIGNITFDEYYPCTHRRCLL
jgi:hypothetical protein